MPEKKKLKVAAQKGGGKPPGFQWRVLVLDLAHREAKFLTRSQYEHLALQVRELAGHDDPTHSETVDVKKIEDFHEIRDKGGVLGKLNVRLFFGVDSAQGDLVVLGVIKKQNDGATPQGDKIRMRRRWRKFKHKDYGSPDEE